MIDNPLLDDAKELGWLMAIEIPETDVELPYAVFIKEKIEGIKKKIEEMT